MTLWFKNSMGIERQIAYCKNNADVFRSIHEFIKQANEGREHPFISYYTRSWTEGDRTWYDVGSHTEFFFTTPK